MLPKEWSRPIKAGDIWGVLVGVTIGLGGAMAIIVSGLPPHQILGFGLLFWIPAMVLHELGHAVGGVVAGGHVKCIKLGRSMHRLTGKHLSFRALGFRWEIYGVPLTGLVLVYITQLLTYRARAIFMTAAGPIVSLAISLAAFVSYEEHTLPTCDAVLFSCALMNAYIFLGTSVPYSGHSPGFGSQNDGYRIYKLLTAPDSEIEQRCFLAKIEMELKDETRHLLRLSLDEAIARYESSPERVAILIPLVDKLGEAKDPRQHEYAAKLVSQPLLRPENVAKFLDLHLTRNLEGGTIAGNQLFDQFSKKLMEISGHSITTRGTRGAVLIDLGRVDEGKAMLLDVLAKTDSTMDKTYSNIFLGLAEKQLGNLDLAREHAETARQINPDCPALKRVADLLAVERRL